MRYDSVWTELGSSKTLPQTRKEKRTFSHKKRFCSALGFVVVLLFGAQAAVGQSSTQEQQESLYDRLGGLAPISVVVSDFIDVVVPDPFLNENSAVDASRTRVPAPYLTYHVTAMVCQATGGPCQYGGRGMLETHAQLNITEEEWDRMVVLFKEVLAKHSVPATEAQELLNIIGSTKADIVVAASGE